MEIMEIVFVVMTIISVLLNSVTVIIGVISSSNKKKLYNMPSSLREYVMQNRALFGIKNHGISMDDLENTKTISPQQMGISE